MAIVSKGTKIVRHKGERYASCHVSGREWKQDKKYRESIEREMAWMLDNVKE
jgi:hypothetical protein